MVQCSTLAVRPSAVQCAVLEVGNLANATESRSHFAMWAVMSSPLILSFRLHDTKRMEQAWPIISNKRVIAVNQRWHGHPGRRVAAADTPSGANPPPSTPTSLVGWEWQVWEKPLGNSSHAVLLVSTGSATSTVLSVPLADISTDLSTASALCVYDLYGALPPRAMDPRAQPALTTPALGAHDSAFYCVSVLHGVGNGSGIEPGKGYPPDEKCEEPASRRGCPT